jgi:hypothetical protein
VRFPRLFCAVSAMAGPITYDVTVNTSSIASTTGLPDFTTPGSTFAFSMFSDAVVPNSHPITLERI